MEMEMEIERKYLVDAPPPRYENYPCRIIEQAYLCTDPVVRIRKDNEAYYLTYKGSGLMAREEYNLPLTEEAYLHLRPKADGIILTKKRYMLPVEGYDHLKAELDVFTGAWEGLILVEVEFATEAEALAFKPPAWFGRDVTFSREYHNSRLSKGKPRPLP